MLITISVGLRCNGLGSGAVAGVGDDETGEVGEAGISMPHPSSASADGDGAIRDVEGERNNLFSLNRAEETDTGDVRSVEVVVDGGDIAELDSDEILCSHVNCRFELSVWSLVQSPTLRLVDSDLDFFLMPTVAFPILICVG